MKLTDEQLAAMEQERGEPAICDCCGYPSRDMGTYRGPATRVHPCGEGESIYCNICASTYLSKCIGYPLLYGEHRMLFGSIGWIANHLQDEIRKLAGGSVHEPEAKE